MDWLDWLLLAARVVVVFFALLISVLVYIWFERKIIADMQTRMGPMRVCLSAMIFRSNQM